MEVLITTMFSGDIERFNIKSNKVLMTSNEIEKGNNIKAVIHYPEIITIILNKVPEAICIENDEDLWIGNVVDVLENSEVIWTKPESANQLDSTTGNAQNK